MQRSLYTTMFKNLNRNSKAGVRAPHKLVLLLAIIDGIEKGSITNSSITLDKSLKESFNKIWEQHVPLSYQFSPTTPFIHMEYEPYWSLCPSKPKQMLSATLDHGLWELLSNGKERSYFRDLLISLI